MNIATEKIQESMASAVGKIAKTIGASAVVCITKKEESREVSLMDDLPVTDVKVVVFKKTEMEGYRGKTYFTSIPKNIDGSLVPIKELLRELASKSVLVVGDRVVCVADETLGVGYAGLIFIFDVDEIFFKVSANRLTENIDPVAIDSVINIAMEIAREGREGHRVGSAFIIGDEQELLPHIKQMIINPFNGYPEEQRKIQDPALKETIKSFAQLDGCFVVNKLGTIITAGAYITTQIDQLEIESGFGTRHRAVASVTKMTSAIGISISESGGIVRIFKAGKVVAKLT